MDVVKNLLRIKHIILLVTVEAYRLRTASLNIKLKFMTKAMGEEMFSCYVMSGDELKPINFIKYLMVKTTY